MTTIRFHAEKVAPPKKVFGARPTSVAVKRSLERMLAVFPFADAEVSLSIVGDGTIRELNREWRKKDEPTDVLSFPQNDLPVADLFLAAKTAPLLLGDIVVSIETAERQARERKRTTTDEVITLLAHGLLHLLGFDHRTDDEEREMDAFVRVLEAAAKQRRPLRLRLAEPFR
jgi:probable rRNA maturation factor